MYLRAVFTNLLPGLTLLLVNGSAKALEPEEVLFFRTGPLSLRPQLGVGETYTDNIFYQGNDEAEDLITTVSPGLKLQLGRPQHNFIQLNYSYGHLFYLDHSELNTGQHTIDLNNHIALKRFTLTGSDRIQLLSNPLGGVVERVIDPSGVATFVRGNVDRLSFDDNYTLSYEVGEKTAVYLRGAHSAVDYEQNISLYDIRTLTGTAGFGYRAFPKTVVFGEVYYGNTKTEVNDPLQISNPSLDFVGGYVGARGDFTPKLTGMAKVGYESREFDDGSPAPSDPVADLSLAYRFSPKRALSLTYSHLNAVSVQYSRRTYTADTVGVRFNQALGSKQKWQATVGGSYALYDYELGAGSSSNVQYDYFRGSFSLAYQIQRWLTASCGYEFEHVSGDTRSVIEYNVNRVNLRLAIGY